jgi:hypothetical protein
MYAHHRLTCLGLTLKEEQARIKAGGLAYDRDPREDLPASKKRENFCNFWLFKSHPVSLI